MLARPSQGARFQSARVLDYDRGESPQVKSRADGSFSFPPQAEAYVLVTTAAAGKLVAKDLRGPGIETAPRAAIGEPGAK